MRANKGEVMKRAILSSLFILVTGLSVLVRATEQRSAPGGAKKMSDAEIVADLKTYIDELVAQDRFSGAVLVARDGKPLFLQAYGLASKSFNVANRVDTKFNLGSMNKMFTAVAVLQLAEKGKLSLEDKVGKHIPDYPNKDVAEKVTIHQLLTHTSGMGSYFNKDYMEASKTRFKKVRDYFPLMANEKLAFEPGARWQYSNSGFMLLGAIVEAASGQDYFDYVREHIYKPAGMTNTDAYEMDQDTPNLAIGYANPGRSGAPAQNNLYLHVVKGGPAGGGFSTVEDLLKFDIALRQHKLLSQKYTELLYTGKVEAGGPNRKYAYGFGESREGGTRIVGHSGGFAGINSQLDIYLDLGYTVAVMSNYSPPAAGRIADRVRKRLTGEPVMSAISLPPEALKRYTGKYDGKSGERSIAFSVEAEGNALWFVIGRERHKFLPISETEFFDEDYENVRATFIKDAGGNFSSFKLVGAAPVEIIAVKQK